MDLPAESLSGLTAADKLVTAAEAAVVAANGPNASSIDIDNKVLGWSILNDPQA